MKTRKLNTEATPIVAQPAAEVKQTEARPAHIWDYLGKTESEWREAEARRKEARREAERQTAARIAEGKRKPYQTAKTKAEKEAEREAARMERIADNAEAASGLELLKQWFELGEGTPNWEDSLYRLGLTAAGSTAKKLADPQNRADLKPTADGASNSGQNPKMLALRRDVYADYHTAAVNLPLMVDRAYGVKWKQNGEAETEVIDRRAADAVDAMIADTIGDGLPVVHDGVVKLLELYREAEAAGQIGRGWMDEPQTLRRPSRRVYLPGDNVEWVEEELSPVRQVFRACRKGVADTAAAKADPRCKYTYIAEVVRDGEAADDTAADEIYRRMDKFSDIGGETMGIYSASEYGAWELETVMELLNLTARQAEIVRRRYAGQSVKAVAASLSVSPQAIYDHMRRLSEKCARLGFMPSEAAQRRMDRDRAAEARVANVREVARLIAEAQHREATGQTEAAEDIYCVAYGIAEENAINQHDISEARKRILWEVAEALRRADGMNGEAAEALRESAYATAEAYHVRAAEIAYRA